LFLSPSHLEALLAAAAREAAAIVGERAAGAMPRHMRASDGFVFAMKCFRSRCPPAPPPPLPSALALAERFLSAASPPLAAFDHADGRGDDGAPPSPPLAGSRNREQDSTMRSHAYDQPARESGETPSRCRGEVVPTRPRGKRARREHGDTTGDGHHRGMSRLER
jgi:hypothetical protein